jgi:hypothetical protein
VRIKVSIRHEPILWDFFFPFSPFMVASNLVWNQDSRYEPQGLFSVKSGSRFCTNICYCRTQYRKLTSRKVLSGQHSFPPRPIRTTASLSLAKSCQPPPPPSKPDAQTQIYRFSKYAKIMRLYPSPVKCAHMHITWEILIDIDSSLR